MEPRAKQRLKEYFEEEYPNDLGDSEDRWLSELMLYDVWKSRGIGVYSQPVFSHMWYYIGDSLCPTPWRDLVQTLRA